MTSAFWAAACGATTTSAAATAVASANGKGSFMVVSSIVGYGVDAIRASRSARTPRLQERAQRKCAVLQRAHLCIVVDMGDTEAPCVAEGPFIVVHQRPDEITAYVDAGSDGLVDRLQVALDETDALRVRHRAVDNLVV